MSSTVPSASLVKYEVPVLVSEANKKKTAKSGSTTSKKPGAGSKKTLPPVESKAQPTTEDILNSIILPRQWEDNGQSWVQYVSSTPATRLDVFKLQEELDKQLAVRKAKETGICPVREELYAQTFDELIRQVTVSCAERGLLMLRVRDEIRMTIAAYKTLYESSVAFGMRKALLAEHGKSEMQQKIKQLEREKENTEKQVRDWAAKYEAFEKSVTEKRKAEEKKAEEEIQFLKKQNQQYKGELDRLISLPKKI